MQALIEQIVKETRKKVRAEIDAALDKALDAPSVAVTSDTSSTTVEGLVRVSKVTRSPVVNDRTILAALKEPLGLRELAAKLDYPSVDLKPILKRLREEKKLKVKGRRRGMTYEART